MLAACLGAAAGLVFAPAALSQTGAIAYSDADGSLYLASLTAANPTTLFQADTSTYLVALAVSPDGDQVLALDDGDTEQLMLVPTAGGGAPAPVSGTDGADSGAFSPDGKTIAFSVSPYSDSNLDPGIYTVPAAGGTPKKIVATPTDDEDSSVQFSPDGKSVAFARDDVDSHGNETVTLELAPVATGATNALATGLIPDPTDGQRLSFSPDGTTIAYAGDFEDPGIYAVGVAGGTPNQLTTDFDYWPSYSADGSHVYFSRDSGSDNAEDTSVDDVYELWTIKKDGTGPAIVSEGDFEDLVLGTIAAATGGGGGGGVGGGGGGGGAGGGPGSAPTTTTTPTGAPTTTTTTAGSTATTPKTTATKPKAGATHVKVTAKKGGRYLVRWNGKASEWKVTLKVGRKTASAKLRGTIHSHTFVLPGAKGHASASVKPA
jgi:hypothetical protein